MTTASSSFMVEGMNTAEKTPQATRVDDLYDIFVYARNKLGLCPVVDQLYAEYRVAFDAWLNSFEMTPRPIWFHATK